MQLVGDLACAEALADQAEDLQFTIAEFLKRQAGAGPSCAHHLGGDLGSHGVAQVDLASEHSANGAHQCLRGFAFGNVAAGAAAQGALDEQHILVHGDHQHRQPRPAQPDVLDQVQAVGIFQSQINNHQVGPGVRNDFQGLHRGLGRAAYRQVSFAPDGLRQPFAQHGMIVHQYYAPAVVRRSLSLRFACCRDHNH